MLERSKEATESMDKDKNNQNSGYDYNEPIDFRPNRIDSRLESLDGKIENTRTELSNKLDKVEEKLSGKITELNTKIDEVDKKLSGGIKELNTKIDEVDKRLNEKIDVNVKWIIGTIFASGGLLFTLLKLFL